MLQFIPNSAVYFFSGQWAMPIREWFIREFILFKSLIKPVGKPVNRFANQFEWFVQLLAARAESSEADLNQCCQFSDFVARFSDFSDPFSDFFVLKRLAKNLVTFGQTLVTFQMSPVLSCERKILSYTSPCVCSDQWALAPTEWISTFQWPQGSWHVCEWAAHVHTVLPRTNHLPASPLFEIKLFNLTVFSSFFFFVLLILLMHLYYSLSQSFSSFQFLNSSEIVYWATSERLYVIVLTHTQQ